MEAVAVRRMTKPIMVVAWWLPQEVPTFAPSWHLPGWRGRRRRRPWWCSWSSWSAALKSNFKVGWLTLAWLHAEWLEEAERLNNQHSTVSTPSSRAAASKASTANQPSSSSSSSSSTFCCCHLRPSLPPGHACSSARRKPWLLDIPSLPRKPMTIKLNPLPTLSLS